MPVEFARGQWREMDRAASEVRRHPHPGANTLSWHRDCMVWSSDRLLERGVDVSDPWRPRTVPVPPERHPRTKGEVRRFDAELLDLAYRFDLSFTETAAGTHVIYSAVPHEDLVEVLSGYVDGYPTEISKEEVARWISRSNLEVSALACATWLLEPAGEMKSRVAELDRACMERMSDAGEMWTLASKSIQSGNDKLPQDERLAATNAMGGWSAARLSLGNDAGRELNRVLGSSEVPRNVRYGLLYQELPSATLLAWHKWKAQVPLRSAGRREKNLKRRVVDEILEALGDEASMHRGKIMQEGFGAETQEEEARPEERTGETDELLEEFEREATLRQEIDALGGWVEQAALSKQQLQVYELDRQTGLDTEAVASQLGMTNNHVRQVRLNYIRKIRKAREAAGF
jgi:hypothetical protein